MNWRKQLLCTAMLPVLLLLGPVAHSDLVDISIEFSGDGISDPGDLFHWSGTVHADSTDFAGGTWQIQATAPYSDWVTDDDGFSYWWEVSVPGSFYVESGDEWLLGEGTFEMTIYAEDDGYSSIDPWGTHMMVVGEWDGTFTDGYLTGYPPIIGGDFSMSAAILDGLKLTVSDGYPLADGRAGFDETWPGPVLVGKAEPVPEPATWGLLASGAGLLGWLKRRRRAS